MPDHYFNPGDLELKPRTLSVELAGAVRDVETSGGVFSGDGIDKGTRVLLDAAPEPTGSHMLDLGCGWGPITLDLAFRAPDAEVWAVDVNPLALELTRRNAVRHSLHNVRAHAPDEVPAQLRFDTIWSNPPIRIGKAQMHEMLAHWLGRLSDDGQAWLVVQKHLGADSLVRWLDTLPGMRAERAYTKHTFRVLRVWRG